MKEISLVQFDNEVRCLRNVAIKSSIVGSARLTSYYKGKHVVGMVRNYKGYTTYFKNQGE